MSLKKSHSIMFALRALLVGGVFVLVGMMMPACDLIDPTNVRNPQVTDESLIGQPGSTRAGLQGVRFRWSTFIGNTIFFTDVVSDNYDNIATFISPSADFPRDISAGDLTLNGWNFSPYHHGQRLRAQANLTINDIAPHDPGDPSVIQPMIDEAKFYRAMCNLIMAENFAFVPIEENQAPISSDELLQLAIDELHEVIGSTAPANLQVAAQFALARAYRLSGSQAEAVSAAESALALDENFLYRAQFDPTALSNRGWEFAVARALHDMQPLPRLDFLDPKHINNDTPAPVLKAEEAHLILAEAALANNDLNGARERMKNAIGLALSSAGGRTTVNFTDNDPRPDRPNSSDIGVRADPQSPAREGLILTRNGNTVPVSIVSNTSIRDEDIDELDSPEEALRMLYLLRQEIFFFEGRRMSDLGIRLSMSLREIETNNHIEIGDPGTSPLIPDYIPPGDQLDHFSFDSETGTVTILHDMNRVLAAHRISPFQMNF
jgi:hypothetical protein